MTQKTARKKIYVNPEIQGKIVARLAKYWIFYHVGLWLILFANDLVPHLIDGLLNNSWPALGNLCLNFARENVVVLTLPILLFPAILWDITQLTHKVAGPLVRFRNALQQLASGQPVERIKLRKGDLLSDFQDAFNQFLDSDRQRRAPSSKAELKPKSPSQEHAILDDLKQLNVDVREGECQPCAAALH